MAKKICGDKCKKIIIKNFGFGSIKIFSTTRQNNKKNIRIKKLKQYTF